VFSVRVANKGLMLDAASRFAGNGVMEEIVCRLEGSKVGMLKGKGRTGIKCVEAEGAGAIRGRSGWWRTEHGEW
jgi:hypothetical protein